MKRRAMRRVLAVLVLAGASVAPVTGAAAPEPGDLDSLAQRMRACEACHGEQGRATEDGFYPRIAGKPAGYLYAQLRHFRNGQRQHALMRYLLQHQSDAYLQAMARYFAELDLPYPPPAPSAVVEQIMGIGEALVREGDAQREIPACAACHGDVLTGLQPAVPGLLGLPYDYLVAQLGAWQQGVRHASEPDCMAHIAGLLQAQEIQGVAAWLSAQPVPDEARAPSEMPRTEMRCGSWKQQP